MDETDEMKSMKHDELDMTEIIDLFLMEKKCASQFPAKTLPKFGPFAKRTKCQPPEIKRHLAVSLKRQVSLTVPASYHIHVVLFQVVLRCCNLGGMRKLPKWFERGQSCLRQERP